MDEFSLTDFDACFLRDNEIFSILEPSPHGVCSYDTST